jgi:hypothetical protein
MYVCMDASICVSVCMYVRVYLCERVCVCVTFDLVDSIAAGVDWFEVFEVVSEECQATERFEDPLQRRLDQGSGHLLHTHTSWRQRGAGGRNKTYGQN